LSLVQVFRRAGVFATALLLLIVYGASVADAGWAVCFGRDGHVGVEGPLDHEPVAPAGGHEVHHPDHGACVDVVVVARDTNSSDAVAAPSVAAHTIVPVVVGPGRRSSPLRQDGRPLTPFAGFGSALLRI
jgi:hypothetical protein